MVNARSQIEDSRTVYPAKTNNPENPVKYPKSGIDSGAIGI